MRAISAHELPVYFIEIVGFENDGRYDTLTGRCLHDYRNRTEEDVKLRLNGRRVTTFRDGELNAIATVRERACGDIESLSDRR